MLGIGGSVSVQEPAQATGTIGGFVNSVASWLQNRSDVTESQTNPDMRPSSWLKDTLRELTANYTFHELERVGPLVTIGPGLGFAGSQYAYPVKQFIWPGSDVTLQQDPVIFLTPVQAASTGVSLTPNTSAVYLQTVGGNLVGYSMDYLTPKAIQSLLFIGGGVPFKYTRYADQFWFGSAPGSNYQVYLPYQVRHPFSDSLPNTKVMLPEDWHDILSIGAAERGAIKLRWNDQATFLHTMLYGDPLYQQSGGEMGRPGLIAARLLQPERDRRLSPVIVTPFAQRY